MLKILSLAAVIAAGAVLAYAATRPDSFRVTRSTTVAAPPATLHALIDDLRAFKTWNPFDQDPKGRGEYRGPAAGAGASYHFSGGSAGDGSLRIVESAPTRVRMELHMLSPLEARNDVQFLLEPRGAATQVTWSMEGPSPYLSKLIGVFVDMDRMVGGQFEAGLAQLKQQAERR